MPDSNPRKKIYILQIFNESWKLNVVACFVRIILLIGKWQNEACIKMSRCTEKRMSNL